MSTKVTFSPDSLAGLLLLPEGGEISQATTMDIDFIEDFELECIGKVIAASKIKKIRLLKWHPSPRKEEDFWRSIPNVEVVQKF